MSFKHLRFSLLTTYDIQCSGSMENPHTQFFRFVQDLYPSPLPQTPLYSTNPQLTLTTNTQQNIAREVQVWCAVLGCTKRCVNIKCIRGACATHCQTLGGCLVNLHQRDGAMLVPSTSQSFEAAFSLPLSQPPLTTFPIPNNNKWFSNIFTPLKRIRELGRMYIGPR